ncbi:MAG: F0F1 ATP synthase subunit A [Oscillospiraceae bacterium]|nr:F0F1 ATP synthase subunit A [Oscillospiraceae bacterium]
MLRKESDVSVPKQKRKWFYLIVGGFLLICLLGSILVGERPKAESIQEVMRDAVLHESGRISLFGLLEVNPGLISAFVVTGILLLLAALLRIFVIPRFRRVPGKLQLLLETWVSFFADMARTNSPHHNAFLGAYLFVAGSYIFFGTVFELFGLQAVTLAGHSISLPAPLSDINGAIALGCLSYLVILLSGIVVNKLHGAVSGLKEFSLPISMSFRLFGALLSGLLVTELVYYSIRLSFLLPVAVGVLFTLLHAVIQTYVLTTLTSIFFGEVTEPHIKKSKR